MKRRIAPALATGLALWLICGSVPAHAQQAAAQPSSRDSAGSLVLIGGKLSENATILSKIVELADPDGVGPVGPRIAIITAAAAPATTSEEGTDPNENNAQANGLYYADLFAQFGAETYLVPIDEAVDFEGDPYVPANAQRDDVADEIRASTGVFLGGGDQMRYIRSLLECDGGQANEAYRRCSDTPVLSAVRDVLDHDGVVAGVSAGLTIQQSADMVTGGESYQGWRDGSSKGYLDDATALASIPYGGFGFFDEALLDSHFGTWGRQARMIRLAADTGNPRILGVDETTALVYDRSARTGGVIGEGGASIIDVDRRDVRGQTAQDVRWTRLVAGDAYDFGRGRALPGTERTNTVGTGAAPSEVADIWDSIDGAGNSGTLTELGLALVTSSGSVASGVTFEGGPTFRTTLTRDRHTSWWPSGGFEQLRMDIAAE
ncbi:cyanophycinase [Agromyces humatus]|uniref:Cyanophycinase n=1 Tax=Agromyces humatus TaxID=279573 RepID=A0ABP4X3W4_9MICO|nr:hypothetical protein [Agromyces humatus]